MRRIEGVSWAKKMSKRSQARLGTVRRPPLDSQRTKPKPSVALSNFWKRLCVRSEEPSRAPNKPKIAGRAWGRSSGRLGWFRQGRKEPAGRVWRGREVVQGGASGANEPIYERRFVKRGGCGFRGGGVLVQTVRRRLRSPAHPGPGRGRIRARPARRPPSPRPREGGALPLQTPVVRDAWADATCSLNHLFGIAGRAGVAISLVSKGRLHSIARRSAGAAVRVRCGVVLWSSRPPAVARRSALSHTC